MKNFIQASYILPEMNKNPVKMDCEILYSCISRAKTDQCQRMHFLVSKYSKNKPWPTQHFVQLSCSTMVYSARSIRFRWFFLSIRLMCAKNETKTSKKLNKSCEKWQQIPTSFSIHLHWQFCLWSEKSTHTHARHKPILFLN